MASFRFSQVTSIMRFSKLVSEVTSRIAPTGMMSTNVRRADPRKCSHQSSLRTERKRKTPQGDRIHSLGRSHCRTVCRRHRSTRDRDQGRKRDGLGVYSKVLWKSTSGKPERLLGGS